MLKWFNSRLLFEFVATTLIFWMASISGVVLLLVVLTDVDPWSLEILGRIARGLVLPSVSVAIVYISARKAEIRRSLKK